MVAFFSITCHHLNLKQDQYLFRVWVMAFNVTFNNSSNISWRSVLLVEETGVPGENYRPAASHWQTLSHNVVSSGIRTHNVSGDRHWKYLFKVQTFSTINYVFLTEYINSSTMCWPELTTQIWFRIPILANIGTDHWWHD